MRFSEQQSSDILNYKLHIVLYKLFMYMLLAVIIPVKAHDKFHWSEMYIWLLNCDLEKRTSNACKCSMFIVVPIVLDNSFCALELTFSKFELLLCYNLSYNISLSLKPQAIQKNLKSGN